MRQFLHFQSDAGRRLIAVDEIIEVIPMVWLQREAADSEQDSFCGLLNFRGNIVPVFTLSVYEERTCTDPSYFLIVTHTENGMVAVLAHEVDYLVNVDSAAISRISAQSGTVLNVAKVEDEMVRIVKPAEFLG